jgi:hypothetical protein
MRTVLLGLVVALTAGCSLSPSAEMLRELAKDPATICVTITSVYGTVKVFRTAAPNASVRCDQDGLTVRQLP